MAVNLAKASGLNPVKYSGSVKKNEKNEKMEKREKSLRENGYSVETNNDAKLRNNVKLYNFYTTLLMDARAERVKDPVIVINFEGDKINLTLISNGNKDKNFVLTENDFAQCYDYSSIQRNLLIPKSIYWGK